MRILFAIPPLKSVIKPPIRGVPMGVLYLSSYLKKYWQGKSELIINILDIPRKSMSFYQASCKIHEFAPDIIAISSKHPDSSGAHKLAEIAKSINKNCVTIIGGPYATGEKEHALEKDPFMDFSAVGEGEQVFLEFLEAVESRKKFEDVKGLIYRKNGKVCFSGAREPISDIESIPYPDWELLDIEDYFSENDSAQNAGQVEKRVMPVVGSRGCPYSCIYCHNIFGKKLRLRTPEDIAAEVSMIVKRYQIREIEFYDDLFNLDLNRAKKLCGLIIEKKLNIRIAFPNGLRADRMDEELVDKLIEAGTYRIWYAIESGSPRIQKTINKNLDLKKTQDMIAFTSKKKAIMVCGFFMTGFPDETEEDLKMTMDFAKKSMLHGAYFFFVTPYPGSAMFEQALKRKPELKNTTWREFLVMSANISSMSDKRLMKLTYKAARRFYLSPKRAWLNFMKILEGRPVNWRLFFRNIARVIDILIFPEPIMGHSPKNKDILPETPKSFQTSR
ncbi:B12-binding domain-containing radical SAM protein [Elusimicrobiota bacterium]